jgi:hypothetical protein
VSFTPHGVLFLSSNGLFFSHRVVFGHTGLCTSWGLLYPSRFFNPLSCLSYPMSYFFYRTWFLCPLCFYALWRFIFLEFLLLQWVFGSSWDLLWPMWVRCVPWRLFKTFVYTWTLRAPQRVLYPWDIFPCDVSYDSTGSVVPLLFRHTQIVMSEFYVHTSRRYTLYILTYWGLSHHLNILQSISTMSEHVHMRMFDPYTVTTSSKGHVSHRPCGL